MASWVTWIAENGDSFELDLPPMSYKDGEPAHTTLRGDGYMDTATLDAAIERAQCGLDCGEKDDLCDRRCVRPFDHDGRHQCKNHV
jgi:hypothetical protein